MIRVRPDQCCKTTNITKFLHTVIVINVKLCMEVVHAYSMEISAQKTKLMTNSTSGINTEIKVNGKKLETVPNFKYLGSLINDEGSKPEILSRIAVNSNIDKIETSLD